MKKEEVQAGALVSDTEFPKWEALIISTIDSLVKWKEIRSFDGNSVNTTMESSVEGFLHERIFVKRRTTENLSEVGRTSFQPASYYIEKFGNVMT